MARSVSTPCNAAHVGYATFEVDEFYCSACSETFNETKTATTDDGNDHEVCPHCGASDDDYSKQDTSDDFQWLLNDFAEQICKAFPSASTCDEWVGQGNSEDHAVAENSFAYFGVSEYCGLVSMWVLPKDDDYAASTGLRDRWIDQIEAKFTKVARNSFGQSLYCAGRFSNGEAIFHAVNAPNKGELGLGFSSKEGWL